MSLLGAISSYHDSKELFLKQYHLPYKQQTSPPAKNAAASVREKYAEQNATSKG
jgi:hypothetical protein